MTNIQLSYIYGLIRERIRKGSWILLNCDSKDIHAYVLRKYRNQHIVSRLTDNGFLKELWPDVNSVTCADLNNYDKVKHLAEIAGYSLNDESLTWV